MNESWIYNDQLIVSTELSVHIQEFICTVDEYLNKFGHKDFFTFADDKKRDNTYRREYYAFISKIPELSAAIDTAASKLALLLCSADKEMELDLIVLISKKSEASLSLQKELSNFSTCARDIISKDGISPSALVAIARKLRVEAENILNVINAQE